VEPLNDDELDRLLTEWRAPSAPSNASRKPESLGWQWLWRGTFRVPVPVALAMVLAIICLGLSAFNAHATAREPSRSKLSDFRPVKQVQIRILRGDNYDQN